jgi:hypothetical protein
LEQQLIFSIFDGSHRRRFQVASYHQLSTAYLHQQSSYCQSPLGINTFNFSFCGYVPVQEAVQNVILLGSGI